MQNQNNNITIELKNKVVVLKIQEWSGELEVDDILRIDYSNIMGEILTFPLLFNRISNLKADCNNQVSLSKLDLEVFEAQLREEKRKHLQLQTDKRITDTEVDTAVKLDERYSLYKKSYFAALKNYEYLESLYWAAQSKDSKLNKLSEKLRPEEFEKEIVEDTINGIMIKITQKRI